MSIQNNNSILVKNVSQHHQHPRFLNTSLSSNLNGIGMNTNKKIPAKSLNNFSTSNLSISSLNYSQINPSSTYLPSMLKTNTPASFHTNKKYSADYNQAIRFDYSDAFLNNHNIEFLNRVSQMQRLQIETVEWERKKKQSKKKPNAATLPNNSGFKSVNTNTATNNNIVNNST